MPDLLLLLLVYLAVGAFTGLLAGLFGIGGGSVIVPALIASFVWQGLSPAVLTHMALGTSLAAICVSAISSARTHHQHGAVLWPALKQLLPGVVVGMVLGAVVADHLSGLVLQKAFGVFLVLVSIKMWLGWQPRRDGQTVQLPGMAGMNLAGTIIGGLSALFGIGGGSLTVPFLSWYNTPMPKAVGTAAALGLPLALSGAAAYIWQGWGNPQLPAYTSGYIYWPAFAGIASASFVSARLGARLAHSLNPAQLKKAFALMLIIVGVYFLLKGAA